MKAQFNKFWPVALALLLLWLAVSFFLITTLHKNEGHFVYALDDPYIHMAMAKNLSQHGVWGITRYEFSSSSSSVLWTLLVALFYFVLGVNDLTPLILTITFASLLLVVIFLLLKREKVPNWLIFLTLALIVVFTPLPTLVMAGQEHLLHILGTIVFVYLAAGELAANGSKRSSSALRGLFLLTPLLAMVRYEFMFLLAVVVLLFALRKRWKRALRLMVLGITPIVVYGLISVSQGWLFFPNPVILKGNVPWFIKIFTPGAMSDFSALKLLSEVTFYHGYVQLLTTPHVSFLFLGLITLYLFRLAKGSGFWEKRQLLVSMFVLAAVLHMQFAQTGWFFRYEAYLVVLGFFILAVFGSDYWSQIRAGFKKGTLWPKLAALLIVAPLAVLPYGKRSHDALVNIAQASSDIYRQPYQIARFLKQFYNGATVAVNDVGLINYMADVKCLDLWGLASVEVTKLKLAGHYTQEQIYKLAEAKGAQIAVTSHWFLKQSDYLYQWNLMGIWEIKESWVASAKVYFCSTNPAGDAYLLGALRQFSTQLPLNVYQSGKYTQ